MSEWTEMERLVNVCGWSSQQNKCWPVQRPLHPTREHRKCELIPVNHHSSILQDLTPNLPIVFYSMVSIPISAIMTYCLLFLSIFNVYGEEPDRNLYIYHTCHTIVFHITHDLDETITPLAAFPATYNPKIPRLEILEDESSAITYPIDNWDCSFTIHGWTLKSYERWFLDQSEKCFFHVMYHDPDNHEEHKFPKSLKFIFPVHRGLFTIYSIGYIVVIPQVEFDKIFNTPFY